MDELLRRRGFSIRRAQEECLAGAIQVRAGLAERLAVRVALHVDRQARRQPTVQPVRFCLVAFEPRCARGLHVQAKQLERTPRRESPRALRFRTQRLQRGVFEEGQQRRNRRLIQAQRGDGHRPRRPFQQRLQPAGGHGQLAHEESSHLIRAGIALLNLRPVPAHLRRAFVVRDRLGGRLELARRAHVERGEVGLADVGFDELHG